ncbi:peroxidase family protein [Phenylobacterium immobile]|uniref:peroxidase family protein n=1 Tax=Phenylobacterium immobile TaxID=21 RepID=UPI000AFC5E58|nr:peroxidase family protein [Phenylobacterium immobile]
MVNPTGRTHTTLGRQSVRTAVTSKSWLTWILGVLIKVPWIKRFINDFVINMVSSSSAPRPLPFSLWGPRGQPGAPPLASPDAGVSANYISWPGLVDRSYSGRHLPEADAAFTANLPAIEAVRPLFIRGPQMIPCPQSSALFCFFAQWFTDSFLRTDPDDYRKNTSNHEIDLCQIYGLSEADTQLLRLGRGGQLRSTPGIDGEFPSRLFDKDGLRVADDFLGLSYVNPVTGGYRHPVLTGVFDTPQRRKQLFAGGLERANSTIFYSALNTLFLREHNRLARDIAQAHPNFDDDRLFETARNTTMVVLLKLIIEDYINLLSAAPIKFFVDVGKAEKRNWYRTNRISAEFNLLYRWHSLTPDLVTVDGEALSGEQFRFNNEFLQRAGVASVLSDGALQPAGKIGLKNTPPFLVDADVAAIQKSRGWKLRGYNDYRQAFGLPRLSTTLELTRDAGLAQQLDNLYGDVDGIEMMVGLLAEARAPGAPLGELMRLMVGSDAFTQALTNPLLASHVFGEQAFTSVGMAAIEATSTFDDVGQRNLRLNGRTLSFHHP